jgi:serine/threonine protein kinase
MTQNNMPRTHNPGLPDSAGSGEVGDGTETFAASSDESSLIAISESDDLAASILPRGTLLGRFIVLDVIGSGGMGVVYVAYDPELDRKVALKLIRLDRRSDRGRSESRLLREAQALARLSHPNVITVYDVGLLEVRLFLAMEYVPGLSLDAWLAAAPRRRAEILRVFLEAGRGLAAAHGAGLVHRDFKPGNVLVGDDGRVVVLDFGLARAAESEPQEGEVLTVEEVAAGDKRSPGREPVSARRPTWLPSSGAARRWGRQRISTPSRWRSPQRSPRRAPGPTAGCGARSLAVSRMIRSRAFPRSPLFYGRSTGDCT